MKFRLTVLCLLGLLACALAFAQAPDDALAAAIRSGNLDTVKQLIAQGANLKATLPQHFTYLHVAAASGTPEMLALLVEKGLNVNDATADMGITPLIAACAQAKNLDTARWLLEHGADPNAAMKLSADELKTAPAEVQALSTIPGFDTPMMFAVAKGSPELEQLLLQYHATPLTPEARQKFAQMMSTEARDRARETACISNLKQLALGCIMYAQDNNENLPKADMVWKTIGVSAKCMVCPQASTLAIGYGYNAALSGINLAKINNPATTLLFADCKSADHLIRSMDDIDQTRHGDSFDAAFCDGHVERIKAGTTVNLAP